MRLRVPQHFARGLNRMIILGPLSQPYWTLCGLMTQETGTAVMLMGFRVRHDVLPEGMFKAG